MRSSLPRVLSVDEFQRLPAPEQHVVLIELAYQFCLRRAPEREMLATRAAALDDGIPFPDMLVEIAASPEAMANLAGDDLAPDLSDGEFLMIVGRLLNGRGLIPVEIAAGQRFLDGDPAMREIYVKSFLKSYIAQKLDPKLSVSEAHDAERCRILGTDRILTRQLWDERAAVLPVRHTPARPPTTVPLVPSTSPKVSMIASLYRGGRFIEHFLRNITSQTLFDQSELIIVDAASPEGEHEVIAAYQDRYPNIVYERISYRIGIYDAWNRGVQLARGAYLTNTNLDDLRRDDSIALQADMLDRRGDVDIVYQDFFYSFDPDLDFNQVAAFGFKSELPIVTPHNLLAFNSPHNAPMWRKSLHDELGLFDTSYRSAGDYEFWVRCMARGKRFAKLNTPHVVYYQNPEGISTRPDTRGLEESYRILEDYSEKLTSPILLQSKSDFRASFGIDEPETPDKAFRPYYDLLQDELGHCGSRRFAEAGAARGSIGAGNKRAMKILVDGVFFQLAGTGIGRVWTSLLTRLARNPDLEIVLLDRGGSPEIAGVVRVPFPAYTMSYTPADSLLIQEACDELAADVFTSTYYTSAITTPQVQIVYDMIPEVMDFDLSARAWKEKQVVLNYASHFACISANTRHDLLHFYPAIPPSHAVVVHCGVDRTFFNAEAVDRAAAFKATHDIRGGYFLFVGSREQNKGYKNAGLFFDAIKIDKTASYDVVCVGGEPTVNPRWARDLPRGVRIIRLDLSDAELAAAYAGAIALVYPSLYEGFGMPVVEAMASGCPVITTQYGSLGEIGGEATLVISGQDRYELLRALDRVQVAKTRRDLIAAGFAQAAKFDWDNAALQFHDLLCRASAERDDEQAADFHRRWKKLRVGQAAVDVGVD